MRVVFASYNIQYGKGQDGRYDLGRIGREVEAADVIALQEVASGFVRNDRVDQAAWLARELDRFMVFGATWDTDASHRDEQGRVMNRRRRFGNAVLSRWPIRSTRTIPLPFAPPARAMDVQRCAVEAVVEAPGQALRVYSLHLSHLTTGTRTAQVHALLEAVEAAPRTSMALANGRPEDPSWTEGEAEPAPPEACLLLGDFNLRPASPEYRLLVGDTGEDGCRVPARGQFLDAWVEASHAEASGWTLAEWAGQEGARIDHALLHPSLAPALRGMRIGLDGRGSDHLPVFVEMELGEGA